MGLFKKEKKEEKKPRLVLNEVPKKPLSKKSKLIICGMVLLGLIAIFFISTYLRWERDISNTHKVILTDNESITTRMEIMNFYGEKIDNFKLDEDEAVVMYCNKKETSCYITDTTNFNENLLRDPSVIVNILLFGEIILFYMLLYGKEYPKLVKYIVRSILILYGLFLVGQQIYDVANYYYLVNDNKEVVNGTIIKKIQNSDDDKILPVISYTILDKEYLYVSEVTTDKKIGDEITLYTKKKEPEIVEIKRNPFKVLNIIVAILILIECFMSIKYFGNKVEIKEDNEKKEESNSK